MKANKKFYHLYYQIKKEISTYLNQNDEKSLKSDNIKNSPPKDINIEDAGMTAISVMGPSSPEQSLANTSSTGNSMNIQHNNAGLTTSDLKPIYCPAIPYGYKRKKIKIDKRMLK